MTASALPVMPALSEMTGPALGASTAIRALADSVELEAGESDGEEFSPGGVDEPVTVAGTVAGGETEKRKRGRPPKTASDSPDSRASRRSKKAKRLPRAALLALYEETAGRLDEAETAVDTMRAEVAAIHTVGSDVIDQSVNEMVGDVVDLADTAAQVVAGFQGEHVAQAVALEPAQRDRLVMLAARVAKIRGAAYIDKSPEFALGFCVLSLALGKFMAYKVAQKTGPAGA